MLVILTFVSTTAAIVMAVLMWRMRVEERLRSEARVAALAADIYRDDPATNQSVTPPAAAAAAQMFQPAQRDEMRLAPAGWIAAGLIAAAALLLFVLGGGARSSDNQTAGAHRAPSAAPYSANAAPLELVSLQHEREGGRLTIRGIVRNPSTGESLHHLAAVVLLLNADGDLISRERAAVAGDSLPPGGETSFTVTVPNSGDAGRYRISFRTDDRVIPHVDRRT
jgi:hypothetical protein